MTFFLDFLQNVLTQSTDRRNPKGNEKKKWKETNSSHYYALNNLIFHFQQTIGKFSSFKDLNKKKWRKIKNYSNHHNKEINIWILFPNGNFNINTHTVLVRSQKIAQCLIHAILILMTMFLNPMTIEMLLMVR